LNCEFLKSELHVLHSEIINILNNERESVSTVKKANTSSSCNSCAQLEKLEDSEEEINSLKPIIELLKTDELVSQENWTTVTSTTVNQDLNLTSQSNMVQDVHGALGRKQYSVPISNRFAVLFDRTSPSYGNFSTRTSQDKALSYPARKTLNLKSSSRSQKRKESWTPSGICDSIENKLEDGKYTIPSIVNGVAMELILVNLLTGDILESKCTLKDAIKQH
jgi:hypothetical protein